ncbi:MAG: hypothetical protein ACYS80_20020 [Planctomycetota bacterium]|jgi:hypothetical protein
MNRFKTQIVVVMGFGILSLVAGLFGHLALTDIYHGEPDLTLEWRIVQVAALIILFFIGSSLFTLGRALKLIAK